MNEAKLCPLHPLISAALQFASRFYVPSTGLTYYSCTFFSKQNFSQIVENVETDGV